MYSPFYFHLPLSFYFFNAENTFSIRTHGMVSRFRGHPLRVRGECAAELGAFRDGKDFPRRLLRGSVRLVLAHVPFAGAHGGCSTAVPGGRVKRSETADEAVSRLNTCYTSKNSSCKETGLRAAQTTIVLWHGALSAC